MLAGALFSVACAASMESNPSVNNNRLSSYKYSYWGKDSDGNRIVAPGWIEETTSLRPENTAIVIIDPWKATSSKKLNADIHNNIQNVVVPLMESFVESNVHNIFVFTNSLEYPDKTNVFIDDDMMKYINSGKAILCYHQKYSSSKEFVDELRAAGIKNVVYLGYATNICMLYRQIGILPVHYYAGKNLNCFIVPEATLALVNINDEDNKAARDAICLMLAQNNIAKIIHAEDLQRYNWQ